MTSWPTNRRHASGSTRRQRRHIPHSQRPREFVLQRNERERRRIDKVNDAFVSLSRHLPAVVQGKYDIADDIGRGVSKINTLRAAIDYIGDLEKVLISNESGGADSCQTRSPQCIEQDNCRAQSMPVSPVFVKTISVFNHSSC